MRKKIIKTFGFIILSNVPLMTMATNSNTKSSSEASISRINQTFKTKLKIKFINNWVTETEESSNSNITDGNGGVIFEDSHGNLWAMGYGTSLQKYNYNDKSWSNSDESDIDDGEGGVIFEDSRGNLWSMGEGTTLQKYDYSHESWSSSVGSNIDDGQGGVIFEDSRGNLWAMGYGTSLQKYNYNDESWSSSNRSNIDNGGGGVIFEDSRGNLWAMGYGTSLQKYNYNDESWSSSNRSNIDNGGGGVIFEDSRGNLWAMGYGTSLQKYNYNDESWSNSDGSNIDDGEGGVIFEDSRGNLWAMGDETSLQKYDYNDESWSNSDGNDIDDGNGGVIFEDSRGNLWAMGNGTPLQKYNYRDKSWSSSDGSNIDDGEGGVIFEDSRGNLWAMGNETKLQKLTSQNVPNVSDQKIKNFDITFTTRINADGRIAVLIKGYRKYTSDKFTHLRYKKKNETDWKIVKNKIMILDSADYEFKWVIGTDECIASDSKMPESFKIKNGVLSAEIIITTTNFKKENFSFIGFNGSGTIKLKKNVILPAQVKAKYYTGSKSNPDDNEYTTVVPAGLSNDDIVKIKFFIKQGNIGTHKFPDSFSRTPIEIKVANLQEEIPVVITNLKKESFVITGFNGDGIIKLKDDITLPAQVEAKYYTGSKSSPNDNEYTTVASAGLSNDDIVKIKFFIKQGNIGTHKFPDAFSRTPIEIQTNSLPEKIVDVSTTDLRKESFVITGFNDAGIIKLKDDINLPIQVEAKYYTGSKSSPDDNEYTTVVPTGLSNNDIVKIKFFIKEDNFDTHKLPDDFANTPITIKVARLKKIDIVTTNLKKEKFSVTGFNGGGKINLKKGITLPSQTELRYYVGSKSSPNDNEYTIVVPTGLSNNDIVKIKLFIKNEYINTHKLPDDFDNTPITIKVAGLDNKSSNKESSDTTIGIIIGSIVGTITLGILIYYLIKRKKKKTK